MEIETLGYHSTSSESSISRSSVEQDMRTCGQNDQRMDGRKDGGTDIRTDGHTDIGTNEEGQTDPPDGMTQIDYGMNLFIQF